MIPNLGYWRKAPLRWWRTRGFGIHSPFAFGFVNEIARERYGYYAYPAIDKVCARIDRELRRCGDADVACCRLSARGARCLFRIAACLGADGVFYIGHTNGKGEMAMRLARRDMSVTVIGVKPDTVITAVAGWSGGGITLLSDSQNVFECFSASDLGKPMLLVNNMEPDFNVQQVVGAASDVLARQGIVVVRNLNRDSGCRRIENEVSAMMTDCGAQFTSGRATVFVGFKHLQPQRYMINLPF